MPFLLFVFLLAGVVPFVAAQQWVAPARYANLEPLTDELGNLQPNLLRISMADGRMGIISLPDGKEVVPPIYDGLMWHKGIVAAYTTSPMASALYTRSGKVQTFANQSLLFSYRMEGEFQRFLYLTDENTTGMVDSDGKIRIAPGTYTTLESESEGRLIAQQGDLWAVLDTNGAVLATLPQVQMVESYSEGMARFQRGDLFGFLDKTGKETIAATFQDAFPFQHGLAVVANETGKQGCINRDGQWVIPAQYDYCQIGDWNQLVVSLGEYQGLLDLTGNVLLAPDIYIEVQPVGPSLAIVRTGELYGAVSVPGGKVVLPQEFSYLSYDPQTQHFTGSRSTGMGLFDANGNTLVAPQYQIVSEIQSDDNYEPLPAGIVRVGQDSPDGILWGYVRTSGEILLPPAFEYVQEFSDNLAVVVKGGQVGMLNMQGKEVIPFGQYAAIGYQSEGYYVVFDAQNHYGFADKTGKVVVPAAYQEVYAFRNGFAAVQATDGKWGIVNMQGKAVVVPVYEDIMPLDNGLFGVRQGDVWGVVRVE